MVIDDINGTKHNRFLIYDLITFNGQPFGQQQPYNTRLRAIDVEIIGPRNEERGRHPSMYSGAPFGVRLKEFYGVERTRHVVEVVMPGLPHKNDGLIFSPSLKVHMERREGKGRWVCKLQTELYWDVYCLYCVWIWYFMMVLCDTVYEYDTLYSTCNMILCMNMTLFDTVYEYDTL